MKRSALLFGAALLFYATSAEAQYNHQGDATAVMITSGDMANGLFAPRTGALRRALTHGDRRYGFADALAFVKDNAGREVAYSNLLELLRCADDCDRISLALSNGLHGGAAARRLAAALQAVGESARGTTSMTDHTADAIVEAARAYDAYVMAMDAAALRAPPPELLAVRTFLLRIIAAAPTAVR